MMKLGDQVCSLELAKRLKELGAKQESVFVWHRRPVEFVDERDEQIFPKDFGLYGPVLPFDRHVIESYSAFTVAELGEMLPSHVMDKRIHNDDWYCYMEDPREIGKAILGDHSETEADARAKMLIYLLENKLVKP